jgi:hypothetical protein
MVNQIEVRKIKNLYDNYKKAYKEEIEQQIEQLRLHLKYKFKREDEIILKFLKNPTSDNYYRVSNSIFGPNEGNRYQKSKSFLQQFQFNQR